LNCSAKNQIITCKSPDRTYTIMIAPFEANLYTSQVQLHITN